MRFTWEDRDVYPGRRVASHNRSEEYVIGYDPADVTDANFMLVSLADGQAVGRALTRAQMVGLLNDSVPDPLINVLGSGKYAYVPLSL
jgi:hypothetical protein